MTEPESKPATAISPTETKSPEPEAITLERERVKQNERLLEVLTSLEEKTQRQISLRAAFLRGAVYGLGTVIGATILLALFGGIIAATVDTLEQLPFLGGSAALETDELTR